MRKAAWTTRRGLWTLWSAIALAAGAWGCGGAPDSSETDPGTPGATAEDNVPVNAVAATTDAGCAMAAEGCPCAQEGDLVACQAVRIHIGNYTSCEPGVRTCVAGKWGPCHGRTVVEAEDAGFRHP